MRVNGRKKEEMERENKLGKMERFTKAIGKKIRYMATGDLFIKMVMYTKVHGCMAELRDMECIHRHRD